MHLFCFAIQSLFQLGEKESRKAAFQKQVFDANFPIKFKRVFHLIKNAAHMPQSLLKTGSQNFLLIFFIIKTSFETLELGEWQKVSPAFNVTRKIGERKI